VSAPHPRRRHWLRIVPAALAGALVALSLSNAPTGHAATAVTFSAPSFVDNVRAGGEPGIIHSSKYGTLVYSSHEGTTHLDRAGVPGTSIQQFLCPDLASADCYKNHVWIWTSDDHGKSWKLRDEGLTYTGFSDPDLTEDASGAIYNTGIDLANDSLFSSSDGGKTWPTGTTQCHEGDRPWLAGGVAGEVFMTTDTATAQNADPTNPGGHVLYHSGNYGSSCDSIGIPDHGTAGSLNYSGFGKGVYDRFDGSFIEPAVFSDANGNTVGVGISRLPHAADAFKGGGETFQPIEVVQTDTGVFSPFGAPEIISMDSAENIYFAWDSNERGSKDTTGGCSTSQPNSGGGPTPLPNRIMLAAGKHVGPGKWDFLKPISLAHQGNARVLWPWSVAGSDGNISVVWYQMDKMVDPDCDFYNSQPVPDVNTSIYEAHISGATDPATRQVTVTNASGRAIHQGGICDSGTTCVASGQDRRLGDYFTNTVDANGCVLIASGDTTVLDPLTTQPRVTSLPIYIQQTSGPSLTGGDCGSAAPAAAAATPGNAGPPASPAASPATAPVGLPNTAAAAGGAAGGAGLAALALLLLRGRRRRRAG
jgi:hypothetical protein